MAKIKLYIDLIRINRPVGILLLALPCLFGIFFVAKNSLDFGFVEMAWILLLFIVGSVLMRSAGCIVNDIFDRDFDAKVARTKLRPLASGALKLREALILLALLLFLGLIILLQFNYYTIVSGFVALGLVVVYPLMKRITFYPQIFLGITFNYGILMADLAINQAIRPATFVIFAAFVVLTLIYDTIYAFQDIEDDIKVGVKSSAIALSKNPQKFLSILTILMVFLLVFAGFLQKMSGFYYVFAGFAGFLELFLVNNCDYQNPQNCLQKFRANVWVAILLVVAVVFG